MNTQLRKQDRSFVQYLLCLAFFFILISIKADASDAYVKKYGKPYSKTTLKFPTPKYVKKVVQKQEYSPEKCLKIMIELSVALNLYNIDHLQSMKTLDLDLLKEGKYIRRIPFCSANQKDNEYSIDDSDFPYVVQCSEHKNLLNSPQIIKTFKGQILYLLSDFISRRECREGSLKIQKALKEYSKNNKLEQKKEQISFDVLVKSGFLDKIPICPSTHKNSYYYSSNGFTQYNIYCTYHYSVGESYYGEVLNVPPVPLEKDQNKEFKDKLYKIICELNINYLTQAVNMYNKDFPHTLEYYIGQNKSVSAQDIGFLEPMKTLDLKKLKEAGYIYEIPYCPALREDSYTGIDLLNTNSKTKEISCKKHGPSNEDHDLTSLEQDEFHPALTEFTRKYFICRNNKNLINYLAKKYAEDNNLSDQSGISPQILFQKGYLLEIPKCPFTDKDYMIISESKRVLCPVHDSL